MVKQVWAKRSELPMSEVRARAGLLGTAPGAAQCSQRMHPLTAVHRCYSSAPKHSVRIKLCNQTIAAQLIRGARSACPFFFRCKIQLACT